MQASEPSPAQTPTIKPTPAQMPATEPSPAQTPTTEPTPAPVPVPVQAPLLVRLRTAPRYAPELIALAAVDRLGTQAEATIRWLRDRYPHATPDALANWSTDRLARQSRYAILLDPIGEVSALVYQQARLVLHIAAAYGRNPSDPERAAELLALLRVHSDVESARAAVLAANGGAEAPATHRFSPLVAATAGRRVLRRLPGIGLVTGLLFDASALETVGRRATTFYRRAAAEEAAERASTQEGQVAGQK